MRINPVLAVFSGEAVQPVALPSYSAAPSTNAFAESPIAGPRVFSDALSLEVWGLDTGVTENGDGVVQLASNPDASNPRDQLVECSTAAGTGHAFHAEKVRFIDHDGLLPAGSATATDAPSFADTTMTDVFWQAEVVFVEGEAKFFAAYADGSQATELFYCAIAEASASNFRLVTNGTVGTRNHAYGDMLKVRLSRTAAGAITLESNSGGGWLSEGSLTSQTTTALTSFRWGCFGATKASDFRFSATAISDTGFTELGTDRYNLGSGVRAFDQTRATPVLFIPDGMFTGQTQARVRYAAGADPTGGTASTWVALTNRQRNTLALPITGLTANTQYSFQFEVGNASDAVVWTSEVYNFKTLQTLGSEAGGVWNFESCHAQVPFAHPYRDAQYTLAQIDSDYLGTVHTGDMGYEAGATANIAEYIRTDYPTTPDGYELMLREYFADFDMDDLQKAGPYIAKADDHAAINNITLDERGSSTLAETFQGGKTVGSGWGSTTVGTMWTNGLIVQDAWFYRHQYDVPADEGAEPARYWKLGHGLTEIIFIDARWTQSPTNNRQVSVQQDTWIKAQIDALESTTKLVLFVSQLDFTFFTSKSGNSWEDIAATQYESFIDYVAANLPTGCKALFVSGDDHIGHLFHDEVTTTANPTTPSNIIGELIASGGAAKYRFDEPDTSAAEWRFDPGTLTGSPSDRLLKMSGVMVDVNATATQVDFAVSVAGSASTYTALTPPTLAALGGVFSIEEASAQGTSAGTLTGVTSGSTLSLVDDAGGRVQLDGNTVEAGATATDFSAATSHSFTVRETLAGATNTPRDTALSLTVTEAGSGYSYNNTEAETFVNAMTVEPDDTRKGLIDDFIGGLKTDGIYTKLGFLYILAAHDEQAARLNVLNPASNALTGSPTFTTDRGFTSDGTNVLDTGMAETAVPGMTETSATIGIWINSTDGTAGNVIGAAANTRLNPRAGSGNVAGRCFSGQTSNDLTVANRLGLSVTSRTGTDMTCGRNAGTDSTATTASTSVSPGSDTFVILGTNGTPHTGTDRAALAHGGPYLTQTERQNLHTRVNTLLTAIGAA